MKYTSNSEFDDAARTILPADIARESESVKLVSNWIKDVYKKRLIDEGNTDDTTRQTQMRKTNPHFVLRQWVLEEVIKRVTQHTSDPILKDVLHMALHPFEDEWTNLTLDKETQQAFCGDVPKEDRSTQCSCSS